MNLYNGKRVANMHCTCTHTCQVSGKLQISTCLFLTDHGNVYFSVMFVTPLEIEHVLKVLEISPPALLLGHQYVLQHL